MPCLADMPPIERQPDFSKQGRMRYLVYWPGKPRRATSFMPDDAVPESCRDACVMTMRGFRLPSGEIGATFGHRMSTGAEFFMIEPYMLRSADLAIWAVIRAWIADLHDEAQP